MQTEIQKHKTPTADGAPTPAIAASVFDALPDSALVKKAQLVQNPKKLPGRAAPLPFGEQTLWRKVKEGTFPAPVRLSARMTCWRCSDVRAWMAEQMAPPAGV